LSFNSYGLNYLGLWLVYISAGFLLSCVFRHIYFDYIIDIQETYIGNVLVLSQIVRQNALSKGLTVFFPSYGPSRSIDLQLNIRNLSCFDRWAHNSPVRTFLLSISISIMYFSISYMQSNRFVAGFIGDRNEILRDYAKLDAVAFSIQYFVSESKLSLVRQYLCGFENMPYLISWSLLDNIFLNAEKTLKRVLLQISIYVLVNDSV